MKPSRISFPSPKSRKYLYAKIMAYTVSDEIKYARFSNIKVTKIERSTFLGHPVYALKVFHIPHLEKPHIWLVEFGSLEVSDEIKICYVFE